VRGKGRDETGTRVQHGGVKCRAGGSVNLKQPGAEGSRPGDARMGKKKRERGGRIFFTGCFLGLKRKSKTQNKKKIRKASKKKRGEETTTGGGRRIGKKKKKE